MSTRGPVLLPSVLLWSGILRWWWWARSRGFGTVIVQLALFALFLINVGPWLFYHAITVVVALIFIVGARRTYRVAKGRDTGLGRFQAPRQLGALTLGGALVASLLRLLENGWTSLLGLLIGLLVLEFLATPGVPRSVVAPWWSHERMAKALVAARILSSPGKDAEGFDLLPTLRYRGRPHETEAGGIEVTFDLPEGATWQQAVSKHAALASAMRLPVERLHLEHQEDDPACAISITVLPPQSKHARPAQFPDRTVWADGLELGPDRLGRSVPVRTVKAHSAFVGQTGSGKTCLGRWAASHALLDPTVRIFCIDGKDDLTDWRPMEPMCEMFVGGATRESIKRVKELLLVIERIGDERGRTSSQNHAPILVVIDEWHRIREAARRHDPALAKELDSLISELAATARSRNISIWLFTQRGTAEYIPTDLRANLIQRFVGMTYEESEVRYILDKLPEVLPSRTGQFLVGSDRMNATMATVPDFDDAAFVHVCAQALRLRRELPLPPLNLPGPTTPEQYVTSTQVVTMEAAHTLEQAVFAALLDGPMLASELRQELPERLRPQTDESLGKTLGKMQRAGLVQRAQIGKNKGWENVRTTPRTPAVDLPLAEVSGGSERANHAQIDPRTTTRRNHPELAVMHALPEELAAPEYVA